MKAQAQSKTAATSPEPQVVSTAPQAGSVRSSPLSISADSSAAALALQSHQRLANNSSQAKQLKQKAELLATSNSSSSMLQGRRSNATGLPNQLKSGIEELSGLSMDHVRVRYNSNQPAQLQVHAYAQGGEIHVAPGQEQHLPHEAWHVVQQAQGRVRPTMQTKANVQPSSGGTSAVAQAKGGDLNVNVLPRFRSKPGEQLKVKTELEKNPEIKRDTDGNNLLKVTLENEVASWVVENEDKFKPQVLALSRDIKSYLDVRATHLEIEVVKSLASLTPDASTYGRMIGEEAYGSQIENLLAGKGTLHEHLLVQQMFIDKIYNSDVEQKLAELTRDFNHLFDPPLKKDELKPKNGGVDIGLGSMTYEEGHDNARKEVASKNKIPKVDRGGLGPYDEELYDEGTLVRGTDRFTAVENNAFIQSARLILDMPVSGTGLSGSATDMFACAQLFGVEKKADYALAAFSFFAKAGAHTFHEVMLMAKASGFSTYVPGNYISAIPEAYRAQLRNDLPQLSTYRSLLQDPEAMAPTVHLPDSQLHGWKDELELGPNVAQWAIGIKAFIAGRFAVTEDKVAIAPIAEGRSGDAVYKIVVDRGLEGPFEGIFKVFHDADVADNEIQIGEKMASLGVTTPNNKGMARIETREEGVPSKAGVLFELAKGESVHDIAKKVGTSEHEPETRPERLATLEKAVIAVAKQLAALHGKKQTVATGRVKEPVKVAKADYMAKDVKEKHEQGLYESHLMNCKNLKKKEIESIHAAFKELLQTHVVGKDLRKSMTHGDANSGNFIVDNENASIIDVNTAVQSLGPTGLPKKPGAADTGRFLESMRTSSNNELSDAEYQRMDDAFHAAYMPKGVVPEGPKVKNTENDAIARIDKEKLADEAAEKYYRACWVLNQLSHASTPQLRNNLKKRLADLMEVNEESKKLAGKLEPEVI